MPESFDSAKLLAEHAGLKLVQQTDNRGGRFRVQRGRDIVLHTDDIRDVPGFLLAWAEHVR